MATAIANAPALTWIGASDGTPMVVKDYAEGTSETFKRGDIVVYDRSENGIVIMTQGDGGVYGDSDNDEVADVTTHLGIALKAATGTAGSLIPVLIPRPQDLFAVCLFSTDNTTIVAPDVDNIGAEVDFIKGDSNNNSITGVLEADTGAWAKIVDLARQDRPLAAAAPANEATYSAGDRVIVKFQESALASIGYVA